MKSLLLAALAVFAAIALQSSAQPQTIAPAAWKNDRIIPVVRFTSNRAAGLTILNVTRSQHYGKLRAAPGRDLLVLATEWSNHIELSRVKGKSVATAYTVKDLRDNAYLVADGQTLWQLATQGKTDPQDPVIVLLLTTGGEETQPERDPLKSAEVLNNVKGLRFHVIGFGIQSPPSSEQLLAIAERGDGHYWPAAHVAGLERSIRTSVLGQPEQYVVLDAQGREAARAAFGQPATLPEGKYRLQAIFAGSAVEREFSITAGAITSVIFDAPQALVITRDGNLPAMPRVMPKPSDDARGR